MCLAVEARVAGFCLVASLPCCLVASLALCRVLCALLCDLGVVNCYVWLLLLRSTQHDQSAVFPLLVSYFPSHSFVCSDNEDGMDQDMFEPIDDVEDGDMRVDLDEETQEKTIVVSGEPASGSSSKAVEKSKRVTTRYLTKYERARVLGTYGKDG